MYINVLWLDYLMACKPPRVIECQNLTQIIITQLYGFKYSNLLLIIYVQLYGFK